MADQFIGEIRLFAHGTAPKDWLPCDGRLLTVSKDLYALLTILGNRYGGNGVQNFGLPNLNGKVPGGVGAGPGLTERKLADTTGRAAVMANIEHYPAHGHTLCCTTETAKEKRAEGGRVLAKATAGSAERPTAYNAYATETEHTEHMGLDSLAVFGAKILDRHNNMQPYLSLHYYIAFQGAYPPRPGESSED